jgi:hypothetical protein
MFADLQGLGVNGLETYTYPRRFPRLELSQFFLFAPVSSKTVSLVSSPSFIESRSGDPCFIGF